MKVAIINGPNLNLLGKREQDIYGPRSFEDFLPELKRDFPTVNFVYFQSNVEGEIINAMHANGFDSDAIILNAGAYTHTSVAIGDAVAAIKSPVVEVHISNIFAREDYRHVSFPGRHCIGSISGFGLYGYKMAVQFLIDNKRV